MTSQFTFYFENDCFPKLPYSISDNLSHNKLVINRDINLNQYYPIFDLNLSFYPAKIVRYIYVLGDSHEQFLVGHYNKDNNKDDNDPLKIEATIEIFSKDSISEYIRENFLDSSGDNTLNNLLQQQILIFYTWTKKENLSHSLSDSDSIIRKHKI